MSERIYISTLAAELDRREGTIRGWIRTGRLPKRLHPQRAAENGWRYWTPAQVNKIKQWMIDNRMAPGAGLKNFDPTPEDSEILLEKLRTRRS